MIETRLDDSIIAGSYWSYTMAHKFLTGKEEMVKAFAKASPAEKQQILAFIKRHTERGLFGAAGNRGGGSWQLVKFTHLDTGKAVLSVAFKLEKGGLSATEIREVVGLPKLAGAAKVSLGKVSGKPAKRMVSNQPVPTTVAKRPVAKVVKHPIPKRKGK